MDQALWIQPPPTGIIFSISELLLTLFELERAFWINSSIHCILA
jgi:hypothetical protein|uniref:Uncharacterized protein n=1 Tax=Prochlorococcus marinus str. P0902-H212 TaxID=1620696 RepID=A0A0D5A3N9_PROMR|nr:hypothetical protein FA02_0530 [Prochlorococcus marinus str. P0902-H212]